MHARGLVFFPYTACLSVFHLVVPPYVPYVSCVPYVTLYLTISSLVHQNVPSSHGHLVFCTSVALSDSHSYIQDDLARSSARGSPLHLYIVIPAVVTRSLFPSFISFCSVIHMFLACLCSRHSCLIAQSFIRS
jgi:hypothetical protein